MVQLLELAMNFPNNRLANVEFGCAVPNNLTANYWP